MRTVVPSKKFTVPMGVPPVLVTVAEKLTVSPTVAVVGLAVTEVVVAAVVALTVTICAAEVLAWKLALPA